MCEWTDVSKVLPTIILDISIVEFQVQNLVRQVYLGLFGRKWDDTLIAALTVFLDAVAECVCCGELQYIF